MAKLNKADKEIDKWVKESLLRPSNPYTMKRVIELYNSYPAIVYELPYISCSSCGGSIVKAKRGLIRYWEEYVRTKDDYNSEGQEKIISTSGKVLWKI